jgi:hypothetical protein
VDEKTRRTEAFPKALLKRKTGCPGILVINAFIGTLPQCPATVRGRREHGEKRSAVEIIGATYALRDTRDCRMPGSMTPQEERFHVRKSTFAAYRHRSQPSPAGRPHRRAD